MKKRLTKILIPLLILLIVIVGYSIKRKSEINKKERFNRFVEGINLSRAELFKNAPSIKEEYIKWFNDDNDVFTSEEIKEFLDYQKYLMSHSEVNYDEKKVITCDEAKEDVNKLFKLFRYSYGAYGYFGGDVAFNEAKENIINILNGKHLITVGDFTNLLSNNLKFIKDGHFSLSNKIPCERDFKYYYVYNKDEFFKDEKGYYKIIDKKHCYIKEINKDKNIDKYMKYTINDYGKLVYSIGILKENASSTTENQITYSNSEENFSENIVLNISPINIEKENISFKYSIEDNVPISKLTTMLPASEDDKSQEEFINSALDMKNYPVSILDLRGNKGGYVYAGVYWIDNYAGNHITPMGAYSFANSTLVNQLQDYNYENIFVPSEVKTTSLNPKSFSKISNDKLVFVLVDKLTASASEDFIECLMNMDNVILVGTNTMGVTLCGEMYYYNLENSEIQIKLGNGLYMSPYGNDFELNGFDPDILVDSDEALEKVQKLIKYYNLK